MVYNVGTEDEKVINERIIKENEKWFKFFVYYPKIVMIILTILCFFLGVIYGGIARNIGITIIIWLVSAVLIALMYVSIKIMLSYQILHIYYLREIVDGKNSKKVNNSTTKPAKKNYAYELAQDSKNIKLSQDLPVIEENAFKDWTNLEYVIIPNSVQVIGKGAFQGCTHLTNILIGKNVKWIGGWAFENCIRLTSIMFEGTVEQWNAVGKCIAWNKNVPATEVVCSDGTVRI